MLFAGEGLAMVSVEKDKNINVSVKHCNLYLLGFIMWAQIMLRKIFELEKQRSQIGDINQSLLVSKTILQEKFNLVPAEKSGLWKNETVCVSDQELHPSEAAFEEQLHHSGRQDCSIWSFKCSQSMCPSFPKK